MIMERSHKTRPERNHFVPASYLQRFLNPKSGMLIVYDKEKKEWRNQKPEEIMFVKNYNRQEWAPKGVDPYIFERTLSNLENNAKLVIDKLISQSKEFTEDEIINFTVFLSYLRTGVPRQARMVTRLYEELISNFARQDVEVSKALQEGKFIITVRKKESRFNYMRQVLGHHMYFILRMNWTVIYTRQVAKFITTDSPVTYYNVKIPPPLEAGIGLVGTVILFPLSPTHLLTLSHPEYDENSQIDSLTKLEIKHLQEIEDVGRVAIQYDIERRDGFVRSTNEILFMQSDRYVVGTNKEDLENRLLRTT